MKAPICGIYMRVSTQQQEEGTSLDTQEERCRKFAEDISFNALDDSVLSEIWSGDDMERPKLDRIRNAIAEGIINAVIVYDADRLSRRPMHLLLLKHEIREAGAKLYSVMDDLGDDSDVGDLVTHVKGLAGQMERRQIAERTIRGKNQVAQSGRLPCGTGVGLYEYDYGPIEKIRTINETQAPIARMVFQWASDGVSCSTIADRLNEAKIPSKRGKK